MEYVTLNTGNKMPLVGLGTWNLRGEECVQVVSKAIQLGYRLIDTAQMYENEKEVGQGILKSGIDRNQLFIHQKSIASATVMKKLSMQLKRHLIICN